MKFEIIEWEDISKSQKGWEDLEEAAQTERFIAFTAGLVIRETDTHVWITPTVTPGTDDNPEHGQFSETFRIMKRVIRRRVKVNLKNNPFEKLRCLS